MEKVSKFQFWLLIVNIVYVIGFGIYFLMIKNYEFLWYIAVLFFIIFLVSFLHLKFKLNSWILTGASIWGLMHMLGGSVYINGTRLYDYILLNLYSSSIEGFQIFKYDQLAHFYCYIIVTLIVFCIIKPYLKDKINWFVISILLIFIGMGIGALNEIIEFIPVVIFKGTGVGGYYNTMLDIIFNTLGAVFAVVYINVKNKFNKN